MTRGKTKNDAGSAPLASDPRSAPAPEGTQRHDSSGGGSQPPSVPELILAGSRFARYEIVRCVGVGGMGAVFEATHSLLRKRVALKAMHSTLGRSESSRARFLREAETVARIQHPNVVDISDVGVERGIPFLVMEYLEGEDLASLLEREGRLFVQRAIDIALPVVAGLAAVHRLGIVHRDIKPENVFLAVNALGDTVPKLVDFGVSKDLEASSKFGPMRHTVAGTPYYMAPEQSSGSSVLDGRADQYALGVVLYQCLAGVRPYDSESLLELIHMIDAGVYTPLATHCPELPIELLEVVERAMSRRIDARFDCTEAFGQALLPFASEQIRNAYAREFSLERRTPVLPRAWTPEALTRASAETVASDAVPREPTPPPTATTIPRRSVSGVRARDTEPTPDRPSLRTRSRRAFFLAAAITGLVLLGGFLAWQKFADGARTPPVVTVEPGRPRADPQQPSAPARTVPAAPTGSASSPAPEDRPATPEVQPTRRHGKPRHGDAPRALEPKASPVDIQLSR